MNHQMVTFHNARPNTEQDKEIYRIAVNLWNKEHKRLSYTDLPLHLQSQNNKESFLDRFKVVAAELDCSQTVVAHISKDGHYFIHPDIFTKTDPFTPREVARLQTFPDDYFLSPYQVNHQGQLHINKLVMRFQFVWPRRLQKALKECW